MVQPFLAVLLRAQFEAERQPPADRTVCSLLPIPVGELLAEFDFFELSYAGARNGFDENEGIRQLPFGKASAEKLA